MEIGEDSKTIWFKYPNETITVQKKYAKALGLNKKDFFSPLSANVQNKESKSHETVETSSSGSESPKFLLVDAQDIAETLEAQSGRKISKAVMNIVFRKESRASTGNVLRRSLELKTFLSSDLIKPLSRQQFRESISNSSRASSGSRKCKISKNKKGSDRRKKLSKKLKILFRKKIEIENLDDSLSLQSYDSEYDPWNRRGFEETIRKPISTTSRYPSTSDLKSTSKLINPYYSQIRLPLGNWGGGSTKIIRRLNSSVPLPNFSVYPNEEVGAGRRYQKFKTLIRHNKFINRTNAVDVIRNKNLQLELQQRTEMLKRHLEMMQKKYDNWKSPREHFAVGPYANEEEMEEIPIEPVYDQSIIKSNWKIILLLMGLSIGLLFPIQFILLVFFALK